MLWFLGLDVMLNWQAVGALGTWTGLVATFLYFVVKVTIENAIKKALEPLSDKFADSALTEERFKDVYRRLDILEEKCQPK